MAELATSYPFTSGNRLDDRNSYYYTPFGGPRFLRAWKVSRAQLRSMLPPAVDAAPAAQDIKVDTAPIWPTAALCEHLFRTITDTSQWMSADDTALLDQLIRKFETTKRIHAAYRRDDFRAVDPAAYRDPVLYLRSAEIFEAAYARAGRLQGLNALLKIIDTLTGLATSFNRGDAARLARLIALERRHVGHIAARLGVSL